MRFVDIPVRLNDQEILYSWFNILRTAGLIVDGLAGVFNFFGNSISFDNVDTGTIQINGGVAIPSYVGGYVAEIIVRRSINGSPRPEIVSMVTLRAVQYLETPAWDVTVEYVGSDPLVDFSIDSNGEITFSSNDFSGGAGHIGTFSVNVRSISG